MRWTVYLLFVVIASCSSFSREREQQSKIDSLTNELKKKDTATKKEVSVPEQVKKDTLIAEESSDEPKEAEVKENVTKRKEQKGSSLEDERMHEGKKDDSVSDDNARNEEPENYAAVDARNAVLKKVVTDAPTFKPQFLGGFKDIKFNFFNHYAYKLDQVILKVHYIREDGSEIKAETKILKDIAPNSTLTVTAPDHATTGKKLKVTVDAVQCRAIDLCYYSSEPANPDSHRDLDPYRCR